MNMNMNSHRIEEDEMLISKTIYALIDTIGVAGVIDILHGMTGNPATSAEVDLGFIGTALANYAATGYGPPQLNEYLTETTRVMGTLREVPPSDPATFDAWIVALFFRKVDTSYQHPEWLNVRKRAPRHIPPTDPTAFDAWITSFFTCNKANRTHHRDTVRDEPPTSTFVDTLSGGPSGSATAMAGPSYPQPGLPWWIVPPGIPPLLRIPSPVVAATVPRWLNNGESSVMFMSRAHMS